MKPAWFPAVAAAVAALSVPAVAQVAPDATLTGETITFGQYADQSGPNAAIGAARYGLDAYVQSVNARGGVHGKKLRLVSYDDGYKPSQTTALVKKMVYEDHAFAIVGGIGSPTTAAVYQTLDEEHVPLVAMGSGSPIFYEPTRKYVFPAWPDYRIDGKTMATYAKTHFPGKKVAVIYQDDSFGQPILAAVKSVLGNVDAVPYAPGQVDFSNAILRFKAANDDVLILATIAAPAAQILNALPQYHYTPERLLTGSACGYSGIFSAIHSLDGAYCAAFLPAPGSNDPQWKAFSDAMSRYEPGKPAEVYAAWGWLAGQVAVAGLEHVKGPLTRDAFVEALDGLRNVPTIGGELSYSSARHGGITSQFLWQAKDGHWVVVPGSTVR
jgi:branched-chain amino acid transport system substrate-binding protein